MELGGAHSIVFNFHICRSPAIVLHVLLLYVFTYFPLNCEVHSRRLNLKETANLPENRNNWEPYISNVMQEPTNIFADEIQTPVFLR